MTKYLFVGGPLGGRRIELEEAYPVCRFAVPVKQAERYIDFKLEWESGNLPIPETLTYRRVKIKYGDWSWYEYVFSSKSGGVIDD